MTRVEFVPVMPLAKATLAVLCLAGTIRCTAFMNPAAESSISLRGTITGVDRGAQCNLRLFTGRGRLVGERSIEPVFRGSFVDAPGNRRRYYVEISCANEPGTFKSPQYEVTGGRKELDLGTIVLQEKLEL